MVNFRYHLVSLVAIFVALAIGVVLGAGPLQVRVSQSLTTQQQATAVDSQALTRAEQLRSFEARGVAALAAQRLQGSLANVPVALVVSADATDEDVALVRSTLQSAGANIAGQVALTWAWESADSQTYRSTLATPLASHLSRPAAGEATADDIIGQAIVEALVTTGAEAELVKQILSGGENPIIKITQDPNGGAQALVLVGARARSSQAGQTTTPVDAAKTTSPAAWAGLGRAIAQAPQGGVVLGDALQDSSVISQIRSMTVPVTTVDQVGTTQGAVAAVLALKGAGPQARAFGVGTGASALFPDPQ